MHVMINKNGMLSSYCSPVALFENSLNSDVVNLLVYRFHCVVSIAHNKINSANLTLRRMRFRCEGCDSNLLL